MSGFKIHQRARVKAESPGPNRRVPYYIRGKTGIVVEAHGVVPGYEFDHGDDWGPLYSVLFDCAEVFGGSHHEKIVVDLHEPWLEVAG